MSFHLTTKFAAWLKNTSGAIAPLAALAAVPMFAAATIAIQASQLNTERTEFQNAVDTAALALASDNRAEISGLSASEKTQRLAELKEVAVQFIKANYADHADLQAPIEVTLEILDDKVVMTANAKLPGNFVLDELGYQNIGISTEVTKAMVPLEVVMVMDTTGSMSGSRMTGAKEAAKSLLENLYGGTKTAKPRNEYIRTALVPFAAAVRLDTAHSDFNLGWIDTAGENDLSKLNFNAASAPAAWNNYYAWGRLKKSSSANHTWNGCVEARGRGDVSLGTDYNVNDAAPTSGATKFPAFFAPDTPSSSYGVDYIGTSGTPNQNTGLSSSVASSTSSTNLMIKQENYRKYDGRNIGAESTSSNGPWTGCAASKVVPMTYDRNTVENGIDAMYAAGPTLIAEGLAWGWRVISPTEPFTKVQGSGSIPAGDISVYADQSVPEGQRKWHKVMVLMTDGDNDLQAGSYGYNNTSYSAYGRGGETLATNRFGTTNTANIETALDDQMLALCAKIKAEDIELYVSSFGTTISTATQNKLKSCATDAAHYKHAAASSDLVTFFDGIAANSIHKQVYLAK
jgi:Flp pilus assembly protein TadG